MNDAIENRISRRNFRKERIKKDDITVIKNLVNKVNKQGNLTIEFIEDGSEAFSSLKKSYGLFKNVRSMLLLKGNHDDINLKEKIGYYGEELVLEMTNLNLGTCWVGGTYEKESFEIAEAEDLICVILVGLVENSMKDKILRKAITKGRKDIKERIITDEVVPEWILKGLEAVKLAPSARNAQKTMFRYEKGVLSAEIDDTYVFDMVDLGIAKKHFEVETGGHFALGNHAVYIK